MSTANKIWNYFRRHASSATCLVCDKTLSLGSSIPKRQTFGSIKGHLQNAHPTQWSEFKETDIRTPPKKRKKSVGRINGESGDGSVEDSLSKRATIDRKRKKSVGRSGGESGDNVVEERSEENAVTKFIEKCILDLLVVEMLPFSLVESEAFKRLHLCDPKGRTCKNREKSKQHFQEKLLPEAFKCVRQKISNIMSHAKWLSFTVVICRPAVQSCIVLSYTAHFVADGVRQKVVLGAQLVNEEDIRNPNIIQNKLRSLCTEYDIISKMHLMIIDNALWDWPLDATQLHTYMCAAQTLQKVLSETLKADTQILELLQKSRRIVDYFFNNDQVYARFRDCQQSYELPQSALIRDDNVRWETSYLMLERLVEQKTALTLFVVEYGNLDLPTSFEWSLISELSQILALFQQASNELCDEKASISIVIPLLAMLNTQLQNHSKEIGVIGHLKMALNAALNNCFAHVKTATDYGLATIFDPRFKAKYLSKCDLERCYAQIETSMINTLTELDSCCSNFLLNTQNLWYAHDQLENGLLSGTNEPNVMLKSEWIRYLKEPLIARNKNIYNYWETSNYTVLKDLAVKYHSAVPTSLPNEHLFNAAAQLCTERRSRLISESNDDMDRRLFLAYNIKLFKFDY